MKPAGGRLPLHERYDLVPVEAKKWLARVMAYGWYKRGGESTWNQYDVIGDNSPLNHAEGHLAKAQGFTVGTPERIWQLSKAMANLAMQIALETCGFDYKYKEWYTKYKATPAYEQMLHEKKSKKIEDITK